MNMYGNEQHRWSKGPVSALIILGGLCWIAMVVWFLLYSLDRAAVVVAQGLIPEPTGAQVLLAYVSAIVFALPGVGLIVYGFARRRQAGGNRHAASPD